VEIISIETGKVTKSNPLFVAAAFSFFGAAAFLDAVLVALTSDIASGLKRWVGEWVERFESSDEGRSRMRVRIVNEHRSL